MKFEEHATCVVEYKNVFDAQKFINLLEQECNESWGYLSWQRSTVGTGQVSDIRTSLSCELEPINIKDIQIERVKPLAAEWVSVWEKVDSVVWDYRNYFELDLDADEGYRVLKYSGGAEYGIHHDHAQMNARTLSLVAFLNDDYTGGNLVFPKFNISIKPKAGSIIIFPSNFPYAHIAEPVGEVDGTTKYSLVTWFR